MFIIGNLIGNFLNVITNMTTESRLVTFFNKFKHSKEIYYTTYGYSNVTVLLKEFPNKPWDWFEILEKKILD